MFQFLRIGNSALDPSSHATWMTSYGPRMTKKRTRITPYNVIPARDAGIQVFLAIIG
ncbi:MAG: hypothetical protein O7149_04780 [Wolbachia endosymbiont of Hylaeus sinuatus]|uniref:hypothetical protein n=1 Tax=Wolbachia endosymbiont of Cardiocondyla obscurior TaxID=2687307 RepID=UPI00157A425A|nr:hypothetical protein [Wolbachia endosymbiont of Cardiocondyla obscurior]MDX5507895.1 hypothetical protein [Wolbachia endosymbiont of Hylaeus sinuatus]